MIYDEHIITLRRGVRRILSSVKDLGVDIDTISENVIKVYYWDKKNHSPIGGFHITLVDGGNNLFFRNARLDDKFLHKGYGVKLHMLRLEFAKLIGANCVICTTNKNNNAQSRVLEHFNWLKNNLDKNHYIWTKEII